MLRNEKWAKKLIEVIIAEDEYGNGTTRTKVRTLFVGDLEAAGESVPLFSDNVVDYHLHLLETAGYVKVTISPGNRAYDTVEVTWSGHDYAGQ